MFESAEQVHAVDKAAFKAEEPELREALLEAQLDLMEKKGFAVLVLLAGIDGAGKGEALARLNEWLDQRHLANEAFDDPNDEERARPRLWRFWLHLPAKGQIGVFLGSWYADVFAKRVLGGGDDARLEKDLATINRFEAMLTAENILLIKLWLHISLDEQKKRLAEIEKEAGGGRHIVEYTMLRKHHELALTTIKKGIRMTSVGEAPWFVIPSADGRYRDLMIGHTLLDAMRKRLDAPAVAAAPGNVTAPGIVAGIDHKSPLDVLDLSRTLAEDDYKKQLKHYQRRLAKLTDGKAFRKHALVCAFEGNDAAGKGGSIRRVTGAIDPRRFRVHPVAAPTDEEKARPYLWRFWRRIPGKGHVAIFDRTWYGRVLVERVEGFCGGADWMRAYAEINDFEEQLVKEGIVLVKFWLAISKGEQMRRFKARENTAYKRYKITDEDWRNREKWDAYRVAVGDMIDRTSSEYAPWTLVASEDKPYGRITILKTICDRLEAAL
ncbi:MAG: polyphosphate:AMP phosphotransferase [Rhodospirillales bacterium]